MNPILRYGLIYGLAGILMSIINYIIGGGIGDGLFGWISFFTMLGLFIYFSFQLKKDVGGHWTYGLAFGKIFVMGLFYCLLVPSFDYVKFNFIDPSLNSQLKEQMQDQFEQQMAQMEEQGQPDEALETTEVWFNWMLDIFGSYTLTFLLISIFSTLFFNLFISLIMAAVVKDKPQHTS